MAIITSNEYDHIDIGNGSNTNRHMLKDIVARADIANLKDYSCTHKTTTFLPWEQGAISSGTGGYTTSNNANYMKRIRTSDYYLIKPIATIRATDGYQYAVAVYSGPQSATYQGMLQADGSLANTAFWLTGVTYLSGIDQNYYYRIVLSKTNDAQITPEDGINLTVYLATDDTLTVPSVPADAAAVGALKEIIGANVTILPGSISEGVFIANNFNAYFQVEPGSEYTIIGSTKTVSYGALRTLTLPPEVGTSVDFSTQPGWTRTKSIAAGETISGVIPKDAHYMYFYYGTANVNRMPTALKINGIDMIGVSGSLAENVFTLANKNNSLKNAFISKNGADIDIALERNYNVPKIINGKTNDGTNDSTFNSAPYSPIPSLTDCIVEKIRANVVTAGTVHVGVYNGEIVSGEAYDPSKAFIYSVATFTDTGIQEAALDVPVFVGKNQTLIYGIKGVDTAVMKYGGTGAESARFSTVNSSRIFSISNNPCGIDFICKKYYGTNIFDAKNAIYGYYTDEDGKQKKTNNPYGTTNFLYVGCYEKLYISDPSEINSSYKGAFYNDKKQFVSGINLTAEQKKAGTIIDIPTNAIYVKLSFVSEYETNYMIFGIPANNKIGKGLESVINYPKTLHDIFTTKGAIDRVYIAGNGEIIEASTASITDYIDIEGLSNPLRMIGNWSGGFHCACFDSSKECIDGIDTNIVAGVPIEWSLPNGTKYVRLSYKTDQSDDFHAYMFTNLERPIIAKGKSEAPDGNYENFTFSVPIGTANNESTNTSLQDSANVGTDRGLIIFPDTYSATGTPTRLLICQPGTSGYLQSSTTDLQNTVITKEMACAEGFACLEVNGTPDVEGTTGSNGNPVFLRSILAAYKYVTNKYNLYTDGVFVTGYSQGSLCGMQIIMSGIIPVMGGVFYGPDLDLWKIEYTYKSESVKEKICTEFGFTEKVASPLVVSLSLGFNDGNIVQAPKTYSGAHTVPGNAEKAYILNNIEKWAGYNPMTSKYANGNPGMLYSKWSKYNESAETEEDELYNGNILLPCPVKLFVGTADTVTPLKYSKWFQRMAINGGSICDLRVYDGIGHSDYRTGTDTITVTAKDGKSHTTRVDVWEGLLFIRKLNA